MLVIQLNTSKKGNELSRHIENAGSEYVQNRELLLHIELC